MNLPPSVRAVGLVWYRREHYARLRKLFEDGDKLPANFDKWLKLAEQTQQRYERDGFLTVKAYIDPDTFPAWCAARSLNVDARARMEFANHAAYREYGQQH